MTPAIPGQDVSIPPKEAFALLYLDLARHALAGMVSQLEDVVHANEAGAILRKAATDIGVAREGLVAKSKARVVIATAPQIQAVR